ncbi:cysteine desulfurase [Verrucomicrobia bacterium]|nr:cysteine desulfurase [Verrucomicrobiota bacterium]
MRTIYLDYNATTPLDTDVRAAMLPILDEVWGNPSSVHHVGQRARSLLDDARDRVAAVLKCKPSELIFTSGGSESTNLALHGISRLLRNKGRHIITSAVEHHAVLQPCEYLANNEGFEVTFLPVDSVGRVAVDSVRNALRPDTVLVSIMAANNEVGTLQPVAEIGELCASRGVVFHTDAVQCFGKIPLSGIADFNADLVSLCAHKFYGPNGAGLLYAKSPLLPDPIVHGAPHENERRAGTENLAGIIGLAEAIIRFFPIPVFPMKTLAPLAEKLIEMVDATDGVSFLGSRDSAIRLSNTISFTVEGTDSIALLSGLDMEGLCASAGSACASGSVTPSHVALAMGAPPAEANALVRLSLGRESSADDISAACEIIPRVVARCRVGNKMGITR